MVTKKQKYRVSFHPLVGVEDLPLLPQALRDDIADFQLTLSIDPYKTNELSSHDLRGDLRHYLPWRLTITVFAFVWCIGCKYDLSASCY